MKELDTINSVIHLIDGGRIDNIVKSEVSLQSVFVECKNGNAYYVPKTSILFVVECKNG